MSIFIPDDTIPEPLYNALRSSTEEYSKEVKDYLKRNGQSLNMSVTSLNKPTKELILSKRHSDEIQIHPLQNSWHSMLGSAIHLILEQEAGKNPRYEVEVRRGVNRMIHGMDVHIHGKYDLHDLTTGVVQDWKVTSASSMMYPKTNFERQLNVIGYILVNHGFDPKKLQNVYLFPHLDKTKLKQEGYPQRNCKVVDVEFMSPQEVESFYGSKIESYIKQSDRKDKDLEPCSDEERWIRGYFYKGYTRKKGGKKNVIQEFSKTAAVKGEDLTELKKFQTDNQIEDSDFRIIKSKPAPKYCSFCSAAPFCHQHQEYIRQQEKQFS